MVIDFSADERCRWLPRLLSLVFAFSALFTCFFGGDVNDGESGVGDGGGGVGVDEGTGGLRSFSSLSSVSSSAVKDSPDGRFFVLADIIGLVFP